MPSRFLAALGLGALTLAIACETTVGIGRDPGSEVVAGDDGGARPGEGGAAGSADAAVVGDAASSADGRVRCPFGLPPEAGVAPGARTQTYRRSCTSKASCAIASHVFDCCGREVLLGVEASEAPRFSPAGGICGDSFPSCDCVADPPLAEDGETSSFADRRDVDVACVDNVCQTYVTHFACGDELCNWRTEYCESVHQGFPLEDGGVPSPRNTCKPIPASCKANPTCACIAPNPGPTSCTESKGRVTVVGYPP